jgi:hypothetical protein
MANFGHMGKLASLKSTFKVGPINQTKCEIVSSSGFYFDKVISSNLKNESFTCDITGGTQERFLPTLRVKNRIPISMFLGKRPLHDWT